MQGHDPDTSQNGATSQTSATREPRMLVARIDSILPQTQCQRCGFPACRPYAQAMADGEAGPDRCPPGGDQGAARLAALLGQPTVSVNRQYGEPGPLAVAQIREADCIGCTHCIQACPVDAIVGAPKLLHAIISSRCTGCELCLPPCPTRCIEMVFPEPAREWNPADAASARQRFEARTHRLDAEKRATEQSLLQPAEVDKAQRNAQSLRKQSMVAAALARVNRRRDDSVS